MRLCKHNSSQVSFSKRHNWGSKRGNKNKAACHLYASPMMCRFMTSALFLCHKPRCLHITAHLKAYCPIKELKQEAANILNNVKLYISYSPQYTPLNIINSSEKSAWILTWLKHLTLYRSRDDNYQTIKDKDWMLWDSYGRIFETSKELIYQLLHPQAELK